MGKIKFSIIRFKLIPTVLLFLLSTMACHVPQSKGIKTVPVIDDFTSFIGLRHGDSYEKVVSLFGEPESYEEYKGIETLGIIRTFYVSYYDKGLRIGCNQYLDGTKVSTIRIKSEKAAAAIRKYVSNDVKLGFYGKHKQIIMDQLGRPNRIHSGNHEYRITTAKRGLVNFICYDFHDYLCKEIATQWFYRGKSLPRSQPPVPPAPSSLVSVSHPRDFLSFIGLRHGDSYEKVKSLFGEPDSYEEYRGSETLGIIRRFYVSYYGNGLRISCNQYEDGTKVATIRIKSEKAVAAIRKYVSDDVKLNFYGMHKQTIMDQLGRPDEIHSGNHEYRITTAKRGLVNFICYDFNDYLCKEIATQWFYQRKSLPRSQIPVPPAPSSLVSVSHPRDFLSFIGLRHGDSYEKVKSLFGEPESYKEYEGSKTLGIIRTFYVSYYGNGLRIGCNQYVDGTKVATIRIKSERAVAAIRKYVSDDVKLNFYGMHKQTIMDKFGRPDEIRSDNYEYRITTAKRGFVNFICYHFNDYICKELHIHWFY